jgi:hypothetical protein
MKKILFLASFISLLFFLNSAQAVTLDVSPSVGETSVNEQAWYTIHVSNDNYYTDGYVITVLGPHLEWLNLESYYVTVQPSETRNVKVYFYPSLENSYDFEVLVYSRNNENERASKIITLKVAPEKELKIVEFTSQKVGSDLQISMKITAKEKRTITIPLEILDSNENRVQYSEMTEVIEGTKEIKKTVPVGDLLAGNYYVRTVIPQFDVKSETSFYIQPVHNVLTKRETVSTPFGQEVVITVTNEGNTIEDYNVKDTVQTNQYVDFGNNPTNAYVEGSNVNYNWKLEGLAVGKSVTVRYNINRLPMLVGAFIMVFCLVALLGMGVVKVRTPNIKKRHVRKRNEHTIVLQIKGPVASGIKGVIVKDWVSPLGRVIPEFGGPKPVVRESETGTELIWSLGDLRPRSEIYLSYRIQPLIEAQLKMPRATLSYRTDEETKIRVFSREVVLE